MEKLQIAINENIQHKSGSLYFIIKLKLAPLDWKQVHAKSHNNHQ
jgi:hypothetical protein